LAAARQLARPAATRHPMNLPQPARHAPGQRCAILASKAEAGAHHACRVLLQALFIIANTLPVVSTKAAASTINKGVFIARSHCVRAP
jgi:hypothetical protein